jgi:hypothetical protein
MFESLVAFCFPFTAAMFGSAAQLRRKSRAQLRRKRARADISFLLHGFQRFRAALVEVLVLRQSVRHFEVFPGRAESYPLNQSSKIAPWAEPHWIRVAHHLCCRQ